MNAKVLLVAALASCMAVFSSCSDDDDNVMPDNVVVKSFNTKYPNAERVSWETKGDYMVADFYQGSIELEAWFDRSGDWLMTETDAAYTSLSADIKLSFEKGKYADWKIDDVDLLERKGAGILCIIEVEKGKEELKLYFSLTGEFIKAVPDSDHHGYLPILFPDEMVKTILKMYPLAIILDIDNEENGKEVDIIHKGKHKEVHFSNAGDWIYTEWEVLPSRVPAVIMDAFVASEYSNYEIDEVKVIEREGSLFYQFELELGDKDIHVLFDGNGLIVD